MNQTRPYHTSLSTRSSQLASLVATPELGRLFPQGVRRELDWNRAMNHQRQQQLQRTLQHDSNRPFQTTAMVSNAKRRRPRIKGLFDLPPELWSTIVDLSIEEKEIKIFHKLDTKRNAAEVAQPGILRVCSAIRKDYLHLYYQRTTFYSDDHHFNRNDLFLWLRAIGPSNRCFMNQLYVQKHEDQLMSLIEAELLEEDPTDRTIVRAHEYPFRGRKYWHITFGWRLRSDVEEGLPMRYTALPSVDDEEWLVGWAERVEAWERYLAGSTTAAVQITPRL